VVETLTVSGHGYIVKATVPAPASGGGVVLGLPAVRERLGWLCTLVNELTSSMVAAHGNPADVRLLAAGQGPDGRPLPRKAYKAMERLGWAGRPAAGLYVPSRVRRMASEQAGRLLRSYSFELELTAAMLECWPERIEVSQLPAKADSVSLRNTRRHLRHHLKGLGIPAGRPLQPPLPLGDVWSPGGVPAVADLSVVDGEYASISMDGSRLHLELRLPTVARPCSRAQWSPVRLELSGFAHLIPDTDNNDGGEGEGARVGWPCFRLDRDRTVKVEIPVTLQAASRVPLSQICRVYGFDWGVNRLLTGLLVVGTSPAGRPWTANRPVFFSSTGLAALYHRQREQGQHLRAKRDQNRRLVQGLHPNPDRPELDHPAVALLSRAIARADTENRYVSDRMSRLNLETARLAARWAVDQALAAGANAVAVEDLRDMEARGMDRRNRTRMSAQVRGILIDELARACAKAGLWLIIVPARGTSSFCARCGSPIRHIKAPNSRRAGWSWGVCTGCGAQGDRDHLAAGHIGGRTITLLGMLGRPGVIRSRDGVKVTLGYPASPGKTRSAVPTASASTSMSASGAVTATLVQVAPVVGEPAEPAVLVPGLRVRKAPRHPRVLPRVNKVRIPHERRDRAERQPLCDISKLRGGPLAEPPTRRPASMLGYRSAGAQPRQQLRPDRGPVRRDRLVRACDGLRYAYRRHLRASPNRQTQTALTARIAVSTQTHQNHEQRFEPSLRVIGNSGLGGAASGVVNRFENGWL